MSHTQTNHLRQRRTLQSNVTALYVCGLALALLLTFVVTTPTASAQTTCDVYGPSLSVPTGYGASYNVFNTAQMMVSIACNEDQSITVTSGNNDPLTYIYNQGYRYDAGTGNWVNFTYSCSGLIADAWCVGQVSKTLTNLPTADVSFLVSYTCQWSGTKWNCGCSNTSCSTHSWQLQGWRALPDQVDPGQYDSSVVITMDQYVFYAGDLSGVITVVFDSVPAGFSLSDISVDSGTVSNLRQINTTKYQADFRAAANVTNRNGFVRVDTSRSKIYTVNTKFTPTPLPSNPIDITKAGTHLNGKDPVTANGTSKDDSKLAAIAADTSITNWYIPSGKTLRVSEFEVPSHVRAVFGGGAVKAHDDGNTDSEVSKTGALILNAGGNSAYDELVVDGLTFTADSDYTTHKNYGVITLSSKGGSTNGIEIRNCTFIETQSLNGIKTFANEESNVRHQDLYIYDNVFRKVRGYFALEIINLENDMSHIDGYPGLNVFDNQFYSGSALSFIQSSGSDNNLYNNYFDGTGMSLETAATYGTNVYGNYMINVHGQALSDGGDTWGGTALPVKKAFIHNNHIEMTKEGYAYFYGGGVSEVYDNYFKGGRVIMRPQTTNSELKVGEFHHNTVVVDELSTAVTVQSDITGSLLEGNIHHNEVYHVRNTSSDKGIGGASKVTTGVKFTDNKIMMKHGSAICIETTGTEQNNDCQLGYTGIVPTYRP